MASATRTAIESTTTAVEEDKPLSISRSDFVNSPFRWHLLHNLLGKPLRNKALLRLGRGERTLSCSEQSANATRYESSIICVFRRNTNFTVECMFQISVNGGMQFQFINMKINNAWNNQRTDLINGFLKTFRWSAYSYEDSCCQVRICTWETQCLWVKEHWK